MQTVVLLGTSIEIAEARWLPLGLRVLILYFALLFGVYAISDVQRHIVPFTRIARGLTISPKDALGYRDSRMASGLLVARILLDLLLPLLLAAIGVAIMPLALR